MKSRGVIFSITRRGNKMKTKRNLGFAASLLILGTPIIDSQAEESDLQSERSFIKGGIYDKPYITRSERGTVFGGYVETAFQFEREEGIKEELTFSVERFNIFVFSPVSDRVRLAAEIEFEEGGEEVKIELAMIDFEIHPSLTLRGGILLSPLGKFNLAHDSPTNEVNDRPLVSTEIIPTTLSEPGMGFYGSIYPAANSRITYEVYLVNGLNSGTLDGSPDGARTASGKSNFEDNNSYPSFVGRLGISPTIDIEIGVSAHTGPYNQWLVDGLEIDERRDVTILAADVEASWNKFNFLGEYADANIDVPTASNGILAESQNGFYTQLGYSFFENVFAELPDSRFTGVMRYDFVDFNTDINGESQKRLTFGLNFRPTYDTVFKLDYQRNWTRDGFDTESKSAGLAFGIASYF